MNFLSALIIIGFILLVGLAIWSVVVAPKKRSELLWKRFVRKHKLSHVGDVYTGIIKERRLTMQKNPFTIETTPIAPKGLRVVITKGIVLPAGGLSLVSIPETKDVVIKANKPELVKKISKEILSSLQSLPLFAITIDGTMLLQTKTNSPEQLETYMNTIIALANNLERIQ